MEVRMSRARLILALPALWAAPLALEAAPAQPSWQPTIEQTMATTALRGADPGEALRDAAGAGNVAQVKSLLDAGAPIESGARHGQTALYCAADKGRLEVVRLLVERSANVNARDTFFKLSPLELALGNGHLEVAHYLLAHGADQADMALDFAVRGGDLALARAALATGRVAPLELQAARKAAEARAAKGEKDAAEVRDALQDAKASARARAPYSAPAQRLSASAGRYRGESGEARVEVRSDGLVLFAPNQPELVLHAVAEDQFENAAGDVAVAFGGRAGLVEGLRVNRAGDVSFFNAVTADPTPLRAADAKSTANVSTARAAPRPWPQFRGERASGNADGQGAPLEWSVKDGRNVRFKTPLPGIALSSPIVWGDRIFVTTAVSAKGDTTFRTGIYGDGTSVDDTSEHSFRLYALEAKEGRVLWEREVFRGSPTVRRHLKSSLANATPVTDGQRVVVLFGAVGVLASFDYEGRVLWRQDVGILDCNDPQSGAAEWGHASSPVLWRELVIVQGDRRRDSFLAAYRLADGQPLWRVARDEASTWSTPNVVVGKDGDELVTNGRTIRSYDPRDGKLLWTLGPNSEVVVSTPVVDASTVYVTAGYPPVRPVYAVRAGHRGDLSLADGARSSEAVAWSHARGGTYIPTPLLYRGHLYTLNNNGILTCYRADTGEQAYQTRLGSGPSSFAASPVAADGRIYFTSETGEVYVLKAGPEQELLATNTMDEVTMATPAISDGLMVLRTLGHVVGLAPLAVP
jgi:outer membrane protein assembly factor BamB